MIKRYDINVPEEYTPAQRAKNFTFSYLVIDNPFLKLQKNYKGDKLHLDYKKIILSI